MTRSKKLTVGADIEVFIRSSEPPKPDKPAKPVRKGNETMASVMEKAARNLKKKRIRDPRKDSLKIIPCVGIFPGTKAEPFRPKDWPAGYAVQEDNVMLEFNIPPASNQASFIQIMTHAQRLVNKICQEKNLAPVWTIPEHQFKPIDLQSSQAKMFACDPDLNAYTGGVQRDSIPDFGRFRTCGGHIHMGGDFQCPDFVAVLFLELCLTMYFGAEWVVNPESQRAKWYGRPGVYREKPYGFEYRTLSNQWVSSLYSVSDISRVLFTLGEILITTPANTLQQWFRQIEWTLLYDFLVKPVINDNAPASTKKEYRDRYTTLRHQYNSLKLPGLPS